ncbi:hypothetical protein [Geothermobacter hydrogeniphilus]|uniref:Tetratricopeptide repeat-containing protein n=1 Tax=Geothermobacter hydrogeniphilus TaxID=1969733 RepID=A0A1X0Y1U0_9BACT|nr:hypothetical protein [Geothermobacter hydrogeniphilus]ORJ59123.1 hypothetical protein B5V00_11180 [Geothermobacter hydrogeniphilus]
MRIGKGFQLLFLVFVVCGVFYPAIFAGINSVDDRRMFQDLALMIDKSPWTLFLPPPGFYYRPLLMLTFVVDYMLWGQEPSFYHLGNILIHAANACLIFLVTESLLKVGNEEGEPGPWPLLAGLLFAVHPIVTESVDWISGRTDLLGCFFVLLTTLAIVTASRRRNLGFVILGVVAMILAVMSKEIMVFFLPAGVFLLYRLSPATHGTAWCRRAATVFLSPFLLAGGLYFALRIQKYGLGAGFSEFLHRYDYGLFDTVRVFFKAFGFYVKKMFFPLPLNFAIVSASDTYVWVGIVAVAAMLFMLRRRLPGLDLVVVGFYLVFPGVLIALTNIAWTPLAERYVYLATVFLVMGLVHLLRDLSLSIRRETVVVGCLAVFLLPMTVVTVGRNFVWQDNARLYADTKTKSPEFAAMNNELAIALINAGDLKAAEKVLAEGKKKSASYPLLYINQARIYLERGEYDAARDEILKICHDKSSVNIEVLKMLARIDEIRFAKSADDGVMKQLLDTYRVLTFRKADPFYDYRYGQLLLKIGDRARALEHFKEAALRAPTGSHYKLAAVKLVSRLQQNRTE